MTKQILLAAAAFIFTANVGIAQNQWLYISNSGSGCTNYADIGNVSISGNQLTVEANIIMTTNGSCQSSPYHDIVSKHYDNQNVNYLLRPDHAELNTSNGFFATPAVSITAGECHHVAMVYNGATLSFYLDGTLAASTPATGNVITNSLNTTIGYSAGFNPNWYTQFFGYIDEVRIWNIARTAQEIQMYSFTTLPSPTGQLGLLAYYTFQNGYNNDQGNTAYNGTTSGNTTTSTSMHPNCISLVSTEEHALITPGIFPNPSHEIMTFQFDQPLAGASIIVYDVLGREIEQVQNINGNTFTLDVRDYAEGIYTYQIFQEEKVLSVGKIAVD